MTDLTRETTDTENTADPVNETHLTGITRALMRWRAQIRIVNAMTTSGRSAKR